ncbi:heterokaryon incompatibility protein-domain-containing protein [Annulohypoxylon moriforme]|nr:heterokaryon incompatibility protein-domain-containing protein [Annulohypoxylon moriforme]
MSLIGPEQGGFIHSLEPKSCSRVNDRAWACGYSMTSTSLVGARRLKPVYIGSFPLSSYFYANIRSHKISNFIMYLLNVQTYQLEDTNIFSPLEKVDYAIVSHRWNYANEVLYQDMISNDGKISLDVREKSGFAKIEGACKQAQKHNLKYVWIDTCCINKSSSAELSEAINSMYRYYEEAQVCYAYLSGLPSREDPHFSTEFANHEWFDRGWTLQELIAPQEVLFYTDAPYTSQFNRTCQQSEWIGFGTRWSLSWRLSPITGIDEEILIHPKKVRNVSIAKRMSWAAGRKTTRIEDRAYCLMGLFDVNMPLLYGEGSKAFIRLQEEIMKESSDESLFAWRSNEYYGTTDGLLAKSPDVFKDSGDFSDCNQSKPRVPYFITNHGIQMSLHLQQIRPNFYIAALNCCLPPKSDGMIGIYLLKMTDFSDNGEAITHDEYARVFSDQVLMLGLGYKIGMENVTTVLIGKRNIASYGRPTPKVFQRLMQIRNLPDPRWYQIDSVMGIWVEKAVNTKTASTFHVTELNQLTMALVFRRGDGSCFSVLLGSLSSSENWITARVLNGSRNNWKFARQNKSILPQPADAIVDLGDESVQLKMESTAMKTEEVFFVDIIVKKNPVPSCLQLFIRLMRRLCIISELWLALRFSRYLGT